MSLLTRIRELGQAQAPEGKTEELRKLQQTALTGKAGVEETGPRAAPLMEKLAKQQVREQEVDTAQQEEQVAAQLEARAQQVAQQFDAAQLQQMEQMLNAKQQIQQQTTALLNQAVREGKKLDSAKQKAAAEQLGFEIRMNNEEYVQRLQQNGMRARLDNEINFKEELQRSIFAEEMELFQNDLDFQRIMQAEGRDLMEALANLEIEQIEAIGNTEVKQISTTAMYDSLSTLASGSMEGYAEYKKESYKK